MGAGGGDSGFGSGLLGVASNKQVTFPQTEQHSLILLTLGNATIIYSEYGPIYTTLRH